MPTITEPEVDELLDRLSEKLKEIPNGKQRDSEKNLEGLDLARFDSHSPDYHLSIPDTTVIDQQYQAFLTDPRRI